MVEIGRIYPNAAHNKIFMRVWSEGAEFASGTTPEVVFLFFDSDRTGHQVIKIATLAIVEMCTQKVHLRFVVKTRISRPSRTGLTTRPALT